MGTTTGSKARIWQTTLILTLNLAPAAHAQTTALFFDSQPGDFIGQGLQQTYSPADGTFTVSSTSPNRVSLYVVSPNFGSFWWYLDFSTAEGTALAVGDYGTARRYPFTPFNGLDVSGSGRGCNTLTGRFVVREIARAPNGTIDRFAADFEQHCEDAVPALFGAIRYSSTVSDLVPFGGDYPSYRLSLTMPVNGTVAGPGIDCGGSASACLVNLAAAAHVTLTATPDPGKIFAGWTDDCRGGQTTSVHVNGPKQCAAVFEPAVPVSPRTLLLWDSEPGNYIGQGTSEVYSPFNSRWTANSLESGNGVQVRIESVGDRSDSYWTLWFQAPQAELLQAGSYPGAKYFAGPGSPGLFIFGNGRACGGGEFTVRELSWGPGNSVATAAIDFELNCGSASGPVLFGSLQFNSTIDMPSMSMDRTDLQFAASRSGVTFIQQTAAQTIRLIQSGAGTISWTATSSHPWLTMTPGSGSGSGTIAVGVMFASGLPASGTVTGTLAIELTGAREARLEVHVTLVLYGAGSTGPPFGAVDTPLDHGTGISGAVPFTGWALDDIDVEGVTVCRSGVTGEPVPLDGRCGGAAQVFIGDAVFIEGARPDVQAAYSSYPRNSRAGWGLMVLTNMLPDVARGLPTGGNGTYTFFMYARDYEGQVTLLGTRTLTCDNEHATLPFGALDTPGQGEVVSGASYVNFGWAVTPQPKFIPTDGSTITVFVDGAAVGNVSYNHFRPDIASLFPGLANSNGAVGFRIVDTTTLADGLHTIAWSVTDSAGETQGIGSRYFTVANGTPGTGSLAESGVLSATASPTGNPPDRLQSGVEAAPLDRTSIAGRRGWDPDAPLREYPVASSGRVVVRGEELDRFELHLSATAPNHYSAFLRVGSELAPLPIGSRLDAETGLFTWQPGVAFSGTYDLVFVRSSGGQPVARQEVRIILQPKQSGHVGPQVVIDAPGSLQDVGQPFMLAGWAADLGAENGSGINTLHVWAYPLSGAPPVFAGVALHGGARPDVAAVHGDRFRDSGYGLVVQGLAPGNYDLAVFAYSTVLGGFAPASTVRVTVR